MDNTCQLDLCPKPVDPRKSEGSVDSEDYDAIQQWASDGTVNAKSEPVVSMTWFDKKRKAADLD